MIVFHPMQNDEYPTYLAYFIDDYANEIEANYRLSQRDSLARAQREIDQSLPDGVNTAGQVLICLFNQTANESSHIGYLWYKPDATKHAVFIMDFHIFSAYQGQGLGKAVMVAFEQDLKGKGVEQIHLRVAGDNRRALHVYQATGFEITGINMSKNISTGQ